MGKLKSTFKEHIHGAILVQEVGAQIELTYFESFCVSEDLLQTYLGVSANLNFWYRSSLYTVH